MRKYVPLLIAGIVLIVAGCSDSTSTATEVTELQPLGTRAYSRQVGRSEETDAVTATFVISRTGNSVRVGEFTLDFDPDAVCALNSGYGDAYWTQSCRPIGRDIRMTAKIFTSNNKSFVEFYPDIRFNPARSVVVSVVRPDIIDDLSKREMRIYDLWYTKRHGATREFIDESWNDDDMRTHYDIQTGRVWRKLRHFSGYVVHVGACSSTTSDPSCGGSMQ